MRRLVSPAGFLLALLCFGFPFLTVSCDLPDGSVRLHASGVNLVADTAPTVEGAGRQSDDAGIASSDAVSWDDMSAVGRTLVRASAALTVVALGLSLVRRNRIWPVAAGVAAALAGVTLVAGTITIRRWLIDAVVAQDGGSFYSRDDVAAAVHLRYGIAATVAWLVVGIAGLAADVIRPHRLPSHAA
ncbi:hypothetical protein [Cryptosporangium sp. NPDC048952]|uniref:hypothetical protein n=1 Tax=Cryptosporangium sp. NPDC048952 TaxID=3363961 RepID=UPI00371CA05B